MKQNLESGQGDAMYIFLIVIVIIFIAFALAVLGGNDAVSMVRMVSPC